MRHTTQPPIPEPTAPPRRPRLTRKRVLARGERLRLYLFKRPYLMVLIGLLLSIPLAFLVVPGFLSDTGMTLFWLLTRLGVPPQWLSFLVT